MKSVDIPATFNIPFGNSAGGGFIRAVPEASQIGIQDGAASLTTGFPPLNFLPLGSGGVPPFGSDFNGLLYQITGWSRWQKAQGPIAWDSAFSAAVGGYPKGSIVAAAAFGNFWLCTADDNTTDPDTGGANWQRFSVNSLNARTVTSSANFTVGATDVFLGLKRTSSPGATAITLRNDSLLGYVQVEDLTGNFNDFNVTILPPTGTIAGLANYVMNIDRQSAKFTYYADSDTWSIAT